MSELPGPHLLDLWEPQSLRDLIAACGTKCSATCCGLNAFDVRADSIAAAFVRTGLPALVEALTTLEERLAVAADAPGPVVADRLHDGEWPTAAGCLHYFGDWRTEASRALAEVGGPAVVRSEWLTAAVRAITVGIAADRDFSRLPILADALDDAGCDSEPVLAHLRGNHPHGWFCWVTDLLGTTP